MKNLRDYFECQRCGACCTHIGLPNDFEAVIKIAAFLNRTSADIINQYYGALIPTGKQSDSDTNKRTPCPFLQSSNEKCSCEIYPVRPYGCKLYPIKTTFGRQDSDCPAWILATKQMNTDQKDTITILDPQ